MSEDQNLPAKIEEKPEDDRSWGDKLLDPDRPLSPRHRKVAELLAQGLSNNKISEIVGLTPSRISILKSNSRIAELAEQIRDKAFEEGIGARLKRLAEPALNEIERCLFDNTNRYKEQLKQETAKWVLEKIDGKAIQKMDLQGSFLVNIMDKLDSLKTAGLPIDHGTIDVSHRELSQNDQNSDENTPADPLTEEEKRLAQWVKEL